MEPVTICNLVPSASLCDTFHFLHHQLLCVTSQKNARLLRHQIYIPILSQSVKMSLLRMGVPPDTERVCGGGKMRHETTIFTLRGLIAGYRRTSILYASVFRFVVKIGFLKG